MQILCTYWPLCLHNGPVSWRQAAGRRVAMEPNALNFLRNFVILMEIMQIQWETCKFHHGPHGVPKETHFHNCIVQCGRLGGSSLLRAAPKRHTLQVDTVTAPDWPFGSLVPHVMPGVWPSTTSCDVRGGSKRKRGSKRRREKYRFQKNELRGSFRPLKVSRAAAWSYETACFCAQHVPTLQNCMPKSLGHLAAQNCRFLIKARAATKVALSLQNPGHSLH